MRDDFRVEPAPSWRNGSFTGVHLSVVDQSPVPEGSTPTDALAQTVKLAQEAEQLGYRRYWLAEHHNTASLAGTAPEVMVAHVAARTSSIRVGAGGVLLSHYKPLKVAEVFRVLESLHPGRIDLGLGRTIGTDEVAAAALSHHGGLLDDDDYTAQVTDLLGFLDDDLPAGHPYRSVRAQGRPPRSEGDGGPEVWVLGSSSYGASLAAGLGLPFSFAHFVTPSFGAAIMSAYFRDFRPSHTCPEPVASVGVAVMCAETDAEAERLALSADVWHLRPEGAERGPLPSVEDAEKRVATLDFLDEQRLAQRRERRMVGSPGRVRRLLEALAASYGVDEVAVLTVCHSFEARMDSYRLLAEAFPG